MSGEGNSVPGGLLMRLVDLVHHWDVTSEELLEPFELRESDVASPQARFPTRIYVGIADRARKLTGEPGLGYCWGLQMRLSAFGFLGFATMSAATLRDAIDLAIQYAPLGSTAEGIRLHVEGDTAAIMLDEAEDFGDVRDVLLTARLTGLWRIAEALTGQRLEGSAEVALPEPAYHARFAHMVPPVRFDQPMTRMITSAKLLDLPLVMADPTGLRIARDQCERELEGLSSGGRLVRTVRGLLWKAEGVLRSSKEIAAVLHMSPRTLRRKLTLQGKVLSSILDEELRDRALLLLRSSDDSIEAIAERLGYFNAQNFARAFRRWTGKAPAAYRRGSSSGKTDP
jgi:AraC-like DNA-binding protein